MRWDRFFEDIEDQLESEWEAERAALDSEAERLRLSKLTLHERLAALVSVEASSAVELVDGTVLTAPITALGADWLLVSPWQTRAGAALVPLTSVASVRMPHAEMLRTARPVEPGTKAPVSRRATFGFAVRDLVRRRAGVTVHLVGGQMFSGTIDRAGADHLDLALHDTGSPRRRDEVTAYRLVPFASIAWIGADATVPL
jgi:molybdopterin-binding protein